MIRDDFNKGLASVQETYKGKYTDIQIDTLYQRFRLLSAANWDAVCDRVLETHKTQILPVRSHYAFAEEALARDGDTGLYRAHAPCSNCGKLGLRYLIVRRKDSPDALAMARCGCENGENWSRLYLLISELPEKYIVRTISHEESIARVQMELSDCPLGPLGQAIVDTLRDCSTTGEWTGKAKEVLSRRFPTNRTERSQPRTEPAPAAIPAEGTDVPWPPSDDSIPF